MHGRTPAITRSRTPLVALGLTAALALGACSNDEGAAAPSPAPSPAPSLQDVAADVAVAHLSVNSGAVIDRSQSLAVDEAASSAFVDTVTAWLDAHLDAVQRGGAGDLATVAVAGLLDGADPAIVAGVSTGLASPADPLRSVSYDLQVGHDGAPRWIRANITVTRASGGTAQATYVFVPGDDGAPVLIAVEPLGGAA